MSSPYRDAEYRIRPAARRCKCDPARTYPGAPPDLRCQWHKHLDAWADVLGVIGIILGTCLGVLWSFLVVASFVPASNHSGGLGMPWLGWSLLATPALVGAGLLVRNARRLYRESHVLVEDKCE